MPGLSGPELRERLMGDGRGGLDVPTVYISGYPDAFCEPGLVLLDKPFTAEDLLESVQRELAIAA